MHIKTQKNTTRKKIIIAVLITGILGFILFFFLNQHMNKNNNQALLTQKSKDEAQTNSAKTSDADLNATKGDSSVSSKTTQQVPDSDKITVNIDSNGQKDGLVSSTVTINNTQESGSCVFIYSTPDTKPVSREARSSFTNEKNTCSSEIPEVEFNKLGTWNLTVYFYLNDQKSEATKNVTIN